MATVTEIIQNIINQARLLDPAISLEVGTPERKIVEAVAEQIAAAQVDISVLSQQNDLSQMSGIRLDAFANNFGFARRVATHATGKVRLARSSGGLSSIVIPQGTQFVCPATQTLPTLVFSSIETAVMRPDQVSVEIYVQCQTAGTIGNVPSNTINAFGSAQTIGGISTITNVNPLSGGIDGETDEEFKVRFKNSAFRHISGTVDSYLALAVAQPYTTKANVIGPQSRYIEYIQTSSLLDSGQIREFDPTGLRFPHKSTTTISTVPYSKYTYSTGYSVQKQDGTFLKANKDYVFNIPAWKDGDSADIPPDAIEPNITILDPLMVSDTQPESEILLFEHTYLSRASRNDWFNQITNCVDIYINGADIKPVTSEEPVPSPSQLFSADKNSPYYNLNFRRTHTYENPPAETSYLQILYFQPVVSIPDTITLNNVVFTKNTDYFQIEDIGPNRGTVRARDGIEWTQTAISQIGSQIKSFQVNYQFDQNISILQTVVDKNKQITTDPLVHTAKMRYLKLYITVMYSPNTTPDTVDKDIYSAMRAFLAGQYFGSAVQLSDILQVIHNVAGVDNVRWTHENERDPAMKKRVEFVTADGSSFTDPLFTELDFFLDDDELADLPGTIPSDALEIIVKAQNTWNS